jgi:hypothetical protein
MPAVAQPANAQSDQSSFNALVIDDRLSRGLSNPARALLDRLGHSARTYYHLSESLLKYLPAFSHHTLVIMDTSLLERSAKRYLGDTLTEIHELLMWDTGWNDYNAPKPAYSAVIHAKQWITDLFREVADLGWIKPNVTGGPDGEVVFEWWYGQRKLTIYIGELSAEYIQVWGANVDAKITDGDIESVRECRSLWTWLRG